ncbi:hypothetical protein GCM10022226_28580 [Sphaerisporangium flaviroseum]|uniref:Uncharacterized protein n=1 Tax=Sphaerisporangium flaviroseum TaxID=509199 RepID=A0ABP7I5E6_9ACTN
MVEPGCGAVAIEGGQQRGELTVVQEHGSEMGEAGRFISSGVRGLFADEVEE